MRHVVIVMWPTMSAVSLFLTEYVSHVASLDIKNQSDMYFVIVEPYSFMNTSYLDLFDILLSHTSNYLHS